MPDVELTASEMRINREIASSLVGLVRVSASSKREDAQPLGSATLVTIGGRSGLLTAAHVLNVAPRVVGLVRFPPHGGKVERPMVDLGHAQRVAFGLGNIGAEGPDIGFVELPSDAKTSLEARGNVFFNLDLRRDSVTAGRYETKPYMHCTVGVIAEWTTEFQGPSTLVKNIEGFNQLGKISPTRTHAGFDLIDFVPHFSDDDKRPTSYGGMSGGALWRIMGVLDNGTFVVTDKVLHGVVFYETPLSEGNRRLVCHGPLSIYSRLYDAISARR